MPSTKLGKDLAFTELAKEWALSAVLLANGAWRGRHIGIEGSDRYIGKGLEYQNPRIYWFNHMNAKEFEGRKMHIPEGAIVFGGGLASIDVVKV